MRTNVEIKDEIMEMAMNVSMLKTKKEVIEKALIEFIALNSRRNLADLKGKIEFTDGYNYKTLRERT